MSISGTPKYLFWSPGFLQWYQLIDRSILWKYRRKLVLCKLSQNSTQPNMHLVLVLPFYIHHVLLANTLNCIDSLVAAYSKLQMEQMTSDVSFRISSLQPTCLACGT